MSFGFVISKIIDSSIKDLRWQSYVLATIKHETGDTFEPIKEWGSEEYLKGKKYYPYYGRGFIQLTWDFNYKLFGRILDIDLFNNPDLALEPETAWKICEIGMTEGRFTGKSLSDYFNDKNTDWFNARRIINGLDHAHEIAEYAIDYYQKLNLEQEVKARGVDIIR